MIVTLKEPIKDEQADYARECVYGKAYFVYAILKDQADLEPSYMINVYANSVVYEIPAKYFKVVEYSIPSEWIEAKYDAYGKRVTIHSFPEWANDQYFYDCLMNQEPETVGIFKRYAKRYEKAAREL